MELRVHGIGAPAPESVLGAPGATAVSSWRGDDASRSAVRRVLEGGDTVVYDWGPLTSGSRYFALWPLLLPFTILNVAGWMGPAREHRVRYDLHRALVVLAGLALSGAASVWLLVASWIVVSGPRAWVPDGGLVDWLPGSPPTTKLWLGAIAALAGVGLLGLIARRTGRGFETYSPPIRHKKKVPGRPGLHSTRFFDGGRHRIALVAHMVVTVAAWAVVTVRLVQEGPQDAGRVLGDAAVVAGVAQAAILILVGLVGVVAPRRWGLSGFAAATFGSSLYAGAVLAIVIAWRGVDAVPLGPVGITFDAYGWAAGAMLIVAVAVVLVRLVSPTPLERNHGSFEGRTLAQRYLPTTMARLRARVAMLPRLAALPLLAFALTFLATSLGLLWVRWDDRATWRLTATAPANLARATLLVLVGFMVLNLVKSRASRDSLKQVGQVWDVLTFWPRSFHPFAVRPYAERAVPELEAYLLQSQHTDVVVAAHSQGSVLSYAAIMALAGEGEPLPDALVTFGAPIKTLYQLAFPAWFTVQDASDLRDDLGGRWWNVYRFTDHVGRAVFGSDVDAARVTLARPFLKPDCPVPDPVSGGAVQGHNNYWGIPAVRAAVDCGEKARS